MLVHGLLQVSRNLLVGVAIALLGLDTSRVDVALDILGRVGAHCEEVQEALVRLALDAVEDKVEVVIVAIRGYRAVADRMLSLVHLEGRCEVLCVLYHHHGNVADEYTTLQGVLGVEFLDLGTHLLGCLPVVSNHEDGESLALDGLLVE